MSNLHVCASGEIAWCRSCLQLFGDVGCVNRWAADNRYRCPLFRGNLTNNDGEIGQIRGLSELFGALYVSADLVEEPIPAQSTSQERSVPQEAQESSQDTGAAENDFNIQDDDSEDNEDDLPLISVRQRSPPPL